MAEHFRFEIGSFVVPVLLDKDHYSRMQVVVRKLEQCTWGSQLYYLCRSVQYGQVDHDLHWYLEMELQAWLNPDGENKT